MSLRRSVALLATTLLAAPVLAPPSTSAAQARLRLHPSEHPSQVALDWQRIAVRTAFTEGALAPPAGALYMSFASLAVHDAAVRGQRHGRDAATAAVATAAHDVLWEYFPASRTALDADLAASLADVRDGPRQDRGVAIGAAAADAMIASRVGDGRNAPVVYSRTPAPGVWQPPPSGMALAWLGFVEPVVDVPAVALDGPDALTSAAYAADYDEVRRVGSDDSTERSAYETATARFFAGNPVSMYRTAICNHLEREPLGLLPTTRLFARIDAATVTTFIRTWRLKYDVGFWRPFQAIAGAATDGNPATAPEDGWAPLVPNPAYSDYTSGHAAATSGFAEVVRRTLGDDVPLELRFGDLARTYPTLSALEHDALNARIWGGLHFRDAMDDGYHLGHEVAGHVVRTVR